MTNKEEGMDALNTILLKLDNKKTKKAQKQIKNVKQYMQDNDIKIKEKKELITIHRKPMFLNESMLSHTERKRDMTDGELHLCSLPLLVLVKLNKINRELTYDILRNAQSLYPQCLCYPDLKYNAYNHGLIFSCELCVKAFTIDNKFCEIMVKAVRLCGYGMNPEINNPRWI